MRAAVEHSLGVPNSFLGLISDNTSLNVTAAIATTARSSSSSSDVLQVQLGPIPIIAEIVLALKLNIVFERDGLKSRLDSASPLVAKYGVSACCIDHDNLQLSSYGC